MAEVTNTFLDNEMLTNQNSLTHLLDFDEENDDPIHSIQPSLYCTTTDFINKIDSDSSTIMSLNCQSLNAKFSNIKLMIDLFAESNKPIQVLCLQETWLENVNLLDMGQFHIQCPQKKCSIYKRNRNVHTHIVYNHLVYIKCAISGRSLISAVWYAHI